MVKTPLQQLPPHLPHLRTLLPPRLIPLHTYLLPTTLRGTRAGSPACRVQVLRHGRIAAAHVEHRTQRGIGVGTHQVLHELSTRLVPEVSRPRPALGRRTSH